METIVTNSQDIKNSIINILTYIGEDIQREGLLDTPERVVKSWDKLYGGYKQNAENILNTTFEADGYNQIILLKDIEFYSTCEHHLLPFFGKISVGYLPDKKVVGISKLARLVDIFSRRLQIQERMTNQITQSIMQYLKPLGAFAICEAVHSCMTSRGVEKQKSKMITSSMLGIFREEQKARDEALTLCK